MKEQSSFFKKLAAYLHYWQQRDRFQEHFGVGDFIVLIVGEDEAATTILRDFAKEADEEKRGTGIFWFTSKAALSLDRPERILLDDVWTTAAGEQGSIF